MASTHKSIDGEKNSGGVGDNADAGLFFVREVKPKHRDLFAVPEGEDYESGNITGTRAARDFMAALAAGVDEGDTYLVAGQKRYDPMHVIKAAVSHLDGPRRGAAVGFLRSLENMLIFAAVRCAHQDYFKHRIESMERRREETIELNAQEKAEFVARMNAAKAAKRAACERRVERAAS